MNSQVKAAFFRSAASYSRMEMEFEVLVRLQKHFRARDCEHEEKKSQLFKSGLIGEKRNDMDKTNIE